MALTRREKLALAGFGINEALLKGQGVGVKSIKAIGKAAVRLTPYVARGAVATAPVVGGTAATLAAANPISTGLGLGASFLASQPGQEVLQSAAERGAADRIRAQQAVDMWVYENITRPQEFAAETLSSPTFTSAVRSKARKKLSKYNKAVKASMSAVKASKFGGKKGTISNAKSTFGTVNKVVSLVNKGKKVSTKGIRGTIARAARRVLK